MRIKISHPTVVYPGEELKDKFEYASYGTIAFNDRAPIPVPTETLLLLAEEFRILEENGEIDD